MKFTYDADANWWMAISGNHLFLADITKVGQDYFTQLWFNGNRVHSEFYTKISSAKRGLHRALRKQCALIDKWRLAAIRFLLEKE